jgi:diguanylate cyclase (GGDEF)-like protein
MPVEQAATTTASGLPSAFALACRQSRSEPELVERCRRELADRLASDQVWLAFRTAEGECRTYGPPLDGVDPVEVARWATGSAEVVLTAAPAAAAAVRPLASSLVFGLSLVLDLRSVLIERQVALDDAVFQLRALRQVARLLSSAHSTEETEQLVLDFMAEVFFSWWACLYRPTATSFVPKSFRSLGRDRAPESIDKEQLERLVPLGSGIADPAEVGLAQMLPAGTELVVPLDAGGERVAVLLLGARLNGEGYGAAERDLVATLAFASAIALNNAELVARLEAAASTDQLTGLFNRRALEARLEAEISRGVRHEIRTTVAMLDLDRFKVINDTLGHGAGDRYLVLVSQLLRRHIRTLDVVGRLGGDEFVVILPMTNPDEGIKFVQRLLVGFEDLAAEHPEFGAASVSIGMAEAPRNGVTSEAVLAAADAALYAAKRRGGNAVVTADEV